MKSPDEIKKGLECCIKSPFRCKDDCPYKEGCDGEQIMVDALALIQQLEAKVPRWISVEEGMPERYTHVIVATRFTDEGEQDVEIAYLACGDRWRKQEGPLFGYVTHWMPLPESPKD